MKFLNIVLLLICCPILVPAQSDNRISATWYVEKYDINATLPTAEIDRNLSVRATLQLRNVTSRPASSLTLRISPNASVSTIRINDAVTEFAKSEEKIGTASLQRVATRLPSVAAGATITAVVEYKLSVPDNTGFSSLTPISSQFLPLSFWYPTPNSWYFARGADHAPTRVQVAAPVGLTIVAAGTETAGSFDNKLNGQPFFFAGQWDRIESSGVTVFVPKGPGAEAQSRAADLASIAVEARSFTAELLGSPPSAPIRIIGVRRGAGYAGGGTISVDEGVFRRGKVDSLTAMTIAESVVKTWIGDSVAISDDGSGVLREGLSRYLATQFIESKYGRDIADIERMRQRNAYAAVSRRDAPLNTVAPLDDYYFAAVANKGAMFWRLLERRTGRTEFYTSIRSKMNGGRMTLADIRTAFLSQKEFVDGMLDQITETNLQAGLPLMVGGEAKVALRNTGAFDVTVNVVATMANGEKMTAPASIKARSFGEIVFRTSSKITRVEIDPEKLYPQVDYSDDVAPRETTDSDLLLAVKRDFDRQAFPSAEKTAVNVLRDFPRFDDVRLLLARSLLAQNKITEAEAQFKAVLDEKLPTSRNIAWANVGLADIASRTGRSADSIRFAEAAVRADAEYGASLAARAIRNKTSASAAVDEAIKAYFMQFDRAAISNRKADFDQLIVPGDINRFISGISGQATEWKTQPLQVDILDANSVLVEANISARLLTREPESGTAVYRLTRIGGNWRLSGVEIFEVR